MGLKTNYEKKERSERKQRKSFLCADFHLMEQWTNEITQNKRLLCWTLDKLCTSNFGISYPRQAWSRLQLENEVRRLIQFLYNFQLKNYFQKKPLNLNCQFSNLPLSPYPVSGTQLCHMKQTADHFPWLSLWHKSSGPRPLRTCQDIRPTGSQV